MTHWEEKDACRARVDKLAKDRAKSDRTVGGALLILAAVISLSLIFLSVWCTL